MDGWTTNLPCWGDATISEKAEEEEEEEEQGKRCTAVQQQNTRFVGRLRLLTISPTVLVLLFASSTHTLHESSLPLPIRASNSRAPIRRLGEVLVGGAQ
jgi:hypothetical protein